VERRVLVAIFLSFLVLYAYQAFFAPKPQPKPGAPAQATTSPSASGASGASHAETSPPAAPSEPPPLPPAAAVLLGEQSERETRIETAHVIAVFTNRGGRLKSWKLKDYPDRNKQPPELPELVETSLGSAQPLPFSLQVADAATTAVLNSALYTVRQLSDWQLSFEYRNDAGLSVEKSFGVNPSSYMIELRTSISQGGAPLTPTVQWGPGLGDSDSQTGRYAVKPEAIFSSAGSVSRLAANRVATQPTYDQEFEYAGVDDHYFAALAVKPGRIKVTYQPVQVPPPAGSQDPRDLMAFSVEPTSPDQALTFYVGPKDFDTLKAIDPEFTSAIDFGRFRIIVVQLLLALKWIHAHVVSNYGWAIVTLTLVINLILFPLNHKSVVSMRKMQEIQPEAKAIQERYKSLKATDPAKQKMNQELMTLYKEHGVNPASGCLPMLLILPVFLAFYALLQTAIELRGAPFLWWITDLSQPDPHWVLPILVGASQIITQLMTPQPGADPAQQKMMMIMPLVLIYVFMSTPAGALIYWLVGNVWRVAQMQISNYLHPPKIRVVRPAAERRVRRVGGGKTDAARES
jgi:YidC/Oxa1 family membrane protein insertase